MRYKILSLENFYLYSIFLGLLVLVSSLRMSLGHYELSPEYRAFLERGKSALYLPSPMELFLLDSQESLWPERFNPQTPPRAEDAPSIYSFAEKKNLFQIVSREDFEVFRQWTVLANSSHLDSLAAFLGDPKVLETQFKKLSSTLECAPAKLEQAFRAQQAYPQIKVAARAYIDLCLPNSVYPLWWDFADHLSNPESAPPDAWRSAALRFQEKMNDYPGEWSRWFATSAFELGHILAAQVEEKN